MPNICASNEHQKIDIHGKIRKILPKLSPDTHHIWYFCFLVGIVGDWKTRFTVTQNEQIDKFYTDVLGDLDIPFKFDKQENSSKSVTDRKI